MSPCCWRAPATSPGRPSPSTAGCISARDEAAAAPMSGVFISYRRDDSAGHAGRLYDHLKRAFGIDGVFMDLDNIGRGDTFAETLTAKLRESDVLIAVVGRRWLTLTDAAGQRRLDNPDDWVREEIRTAL